MSKFMLLFLTQKTGKSILDHNFDYTIGDLSEEFRELKKRRDPDPVFWTIGSGPGVRQVPVP